MMRNQFRADPSLIPVILLLGLSAALAATLTVEVTHDITLAVVVAALTIMGTPMMARRALALHDRWGAQLCSVADACRRVRADVLSITHRRIESLAVAVWERAQPAPSAFRRQLRCVCRAACSRLAHQMTLPTRVRHGGASLYSKETRPSG